MFLLQVSTSFKIILEQLQEHWIFNAGDLHRMRLLAWVCERLRHIINLLLIVGIFASRGALSHIAHYCEFLMASGEPR